MKKVIVIVLTFLLISCSTSPDVKRLHKKMSACGPGMTAKAQVSVNPWWTTITTSCEWKIPKEQKDDINAQSL